MPSKPQWLTTDPNMTDNRFVLDKLEFYITNVCNLTCGDCNRYNNYKFSGWQRWDQYQDILEQWSKKIRVIHPILLGGEPLLNPDITKWITGVRKFWPDDGGVQILTNGTRLNHVAGLYDVLVNDNWIGVTVHAPEDREPILQEIRKFLKHPLEETAVNNTHHNGMWTNYTFVDANQKHLHVGMADKFYNSNLIRSPGGTFRFYNSNPEVAHENCSFRRFKNYHMIDGKIYKCGPAALMPKFVKQNKFELSQEDWDLLNSYQPLTVDSTDEQMQDFFSNIDEVIPQCKFCPEHYQYKTIEFSDLKKSWKISHHEDTIY
jgi:hypothetical protein